MCASRYAELPSLASGAVMCSVLVRKMWDIYTNRRRKKKKIRTRNSALVVFFCCRNIFKRLTTFVFVLRRNMLFQVITFINCFIFFYLLMSFRNSHTPSINHTARHWELEKHLKARYVTFYLHLNLTRHPPVYGYNIYIVKLNTKFASGQVTPCNYTRSCFKWRVFKHSFLMMSKLVKNVHESQQLYWLTHVNRLLF